MRGLAYGYVAMLLLTVSIVIPSFVLAQNQAVPQAESDTVTQQPELDSGAEPVLNNDGDTEREQTEQRSNNEATPEVFNPSEEIIEDAAVSFPVDI